VHGFAPYVSESADSAKMYQLYITFVYRPKGRAPEVGLSGVIRNDQTGSWILSKAIEKSIVLR